jgi:hypothetical protein
MAPRFGCGQRLRCVYQCASVVDVQFHTSKRAQSISPRVQTLAASGFGTRVLVRFNFATVLYRPIRQGLLGRFEI